MLFLPLRALFAFVVHIQVKPFWQTPANTARFVNAAALAAAWAAWAELRFRLTIFLFIIILYDMYRCPPCINLAIPDEYRVVAEALFPPRGFAPGQGPDRGVAEQFAEVIGLGDEYRRLLVLNKNDSQLHTLLFHFQNNLDLLIQKTWVEKVDEERRDLLQNRIPGFMALLGQEKLQPAIEEFGLILEELAWLLFGSQSTENDFAEYTFRIDTQMGLFWWYGGHLASLKEKGSVDVWSADILWAVLLIGICFLANF